MAGEREPGGWAVHVQDSGVGIPAETAHRLMSEEPERPTQAGTSLRVGDRAPWNRWAAGSRSAAQSAQGRW